MGHCWGPTRHPSVGAESTLCHPPDRGGEVGLAAACPLGLAGAGMMSPRQKEGSKALIPAPGKRASSRCSTMFCLKTMAYKKKSQPSVSHGEELTLWAHKRSHPLQSSSHARSREYLWSRLSPDKSQLGGCYSSDPIRWYPDTPC